MTKAHSKINLREPAFLLWLGQFVGQWKLKGELNVHRRNDGLLEAHSADWRKKVPLGSVFRGGKFVKQPKSPLGTYPVVLSDSLMKLWLTPEEYLHLRNAWHVSTGMKMILTAIEKRILELPKGERDRRWLAWWKAWTRSGPSLSSRDLATHRMLYRRYRRDALPKGA